MPAPNHTAIDLATDALAVLQPIPDTAGADRYPDLYAPGVQATVEERLSQIIFELNRASRFIRSIKPAQIETLIGGVNDEINGFRVFRGAEQPATQTARFGDIWLSPGDAGVRVPRVFNGVGFVEDLYAVEAILMPIIARLQALESEQVEVFQDAVDELKADLTGAATTAADTFEKVEYLIAALMSQKAALASPAFTGAPTAPTALPGTNTTQLATTAFVKAAADAVAAASVPIAQKGAANGVATLDSGGKVPAVQLPSYVEDVIEAANFAALPSPGAASKIYVTLSDGKVFRWSGTAYVEIVGSPGSTDAVPEGAANLYFTNARAQAALASQLAAKQNALTGVTGVINPATGAARAIAASDISGVSSVRALTYAALTSIVSPTNNMLVQVMGRTSPVDAPLSNWYFDAAATDTPNGGTILQPDAGGTGRWKMIHDGSLSASHFGADGASIAAAMAVAKTVRVPEGTWAFAANTTLAAGRKLVLAPGAILAPATGVTLTLDCDLEAPDDQQIFSGAGTVGGLLLSRPVWFGAVGDGTTPDQVAVQKAHDALGGGSVLPKGNGRYRLRLGQGNFALTGPVTFRPSQSFPLEVLGAGVTGTIGSRFTVLAAYAGSDRAILVAGQTGSTAPTADYLISDFSIANGGSTTCQRGLQIGEVNKVLGGLHHNRVVNVHVTGFLHNFRVQNTRLVKFESCSAWYQTVASARGFLVTTLNNTVGTFTGDLIFEACQAVGQLGNSQVGFSCESFFPGNGMAGIRYTACTSYYNDTGAYGAVGAGCGLADIFFEDDCQFDGIGGRAIAFEANQSGAASYIDNVAIGRIYVQGMNSGGLFFQATNSGVIRDVRVIGPRINGVTLAGLRAQGVQGLIVSGGIYSAIGNSGQSAIQVIGCRHVAVTGNILKGRASPSETVVSYFIGLDTVEDVTVTGNSGGGIPSVSVVADSSGATRKSIGNNI